MSPNTAYEWFHRHPSLIDGAVAALLLAWCAPGMAAQLGTAIGVPMSVAMVGSLAWRRRFPEAVAGVVAAAGLVQLVVTDTPVTADIGVPIALYAVAAHSRHRWARIGVLVAGVLGAFLASQDWEAVTGQGTKGLVLMTLMVAVLVVATWVLGDLMRHRRTLVSQLQEQNLILRRDREQRARIAAQEERARIARDMHDVVAHSLSVIIVQSDGAVYAGSEAAAETLHTIGATARSALAETRRLVGVLRDDDESVDRAPQAGVADIADLVDRVRSSGTAVDYTLTGAPLRVEHGVEMAAYRVVQEALTNVLKHAGPTASTQVRVDWRSDALAVDVVDDGRGASTHPRNDGVDVGGNGLTGMAERVAAYGGTLRAGHRRGGGFQVTATLPTQQAGAA